MTCDHCGRHLASLPYICKRCGNQYCAEHRLPESHDCVVLKVEQAERAIKREEGENAGPWFKDEFRLSNVDRADSHDEYESSWSRNPGDERHDTEDRYRESHAKEKCTRCNEPLFEHEGSACRYCGKIYCLDHIEHHTADCDERDFTSQNWKASNSGDREIRHEADDRNQKEEQEESESEDAKNNFTRQNWNASRSPSSQNTSDSGHSKQGGAPFDELTEKRRRGEKIKEAAKRAEKRRYPDLDPSPDVAPDGSLVHPDDDDQDNEDVKEIKNTSEYVPQTRKATFVFIGIIILIIGLFVYGLYF